MGGLPGTLVSIESKPKQALAEIISPRFVVNLVRNVVAYWWLIVAITAYWIISRRVKR